MGAIIAALFGAMGDQKAGVMTAAELDIKKKQLADMAGIDVPALEKIAATHLGPSAMEGVQRDEGLRENQLETLSALRDIANQGGMSLSDKAGFEEAQNATNSADRSRRQSILSGLQQRGQMDSGAALVAQLNSSQDAANRDRASGQQFAGRAEDRKLQALKDLANGSGNLREQDFGEAKSKAAAQDAINQWNAGAQEKANYYNAGLPQQGFQNQMAKVTGQQGAGNNLANFYGQEAQGTRNQYTGYGDAAGSAFDKYSEGGSKKKKTGSTSSFDSSDEPEDP